MSRAITFILSFFIFITPSFSQNRKFLKSLAVEVNYGLNANFFVRSYTEATGSFGRTYLFKKKLLGTVAGVDLKYELNKMSSIGIAYSRSINASPKRFVGHINDVLVIVEDFHLRHVDNFYQAYYERYLSKKLKTLSYQTGLLYLRVSQQEITIDDGNNIILIQERNYKNSYLEEGGIFAGFKYIKSIGNKFNCGIQARFYYLITANTFEAITLTPTLQYQF
jgi:hypothetical protein